MSAARAATAAFRALNELLALLIKNPITTAVMVPTTAMDTEIVAFASGLK